MYQFKFYPDAVLRCKSTPVGELDGSVFELR